MRAVRVRDPVRVRPGWPAGVCPRHARARACVHVRVWERAWERKGPGARRSSVEVRRAARRPRPLPNRPRPLTDSNPSTLGPPPPASRPGRCVRLLGPLARPRRVPAIWKGRPARREQRRAARRRGGGATSAGKCQRQQGPLARRLVRPHGPRGGSARSPDVSPDALVEPGTRARAPGPSPRTRPGPPSPRVQSAPERPGPRPRGRPASPRLSHLNLAHARPAARPLRS